MTSTTLKQKGPLSQPGKLRPRKLRLHLPTSLRTVLVLAFVFLSLLPVASALSFAVIRAGAQARQQVAAQMNSVLQLKISALESDLSDSHSMMRAIAGNDAAYAEMVSLVESGGDAALEASVQNYLHGFLDAKGTDFTEYFLYNGDGTIVASTSDRQTGKIVRAQPYFEASLTDEYIQPPYYEVGSNSLAVLLTVPITSDSGSVVGVLAGRLNMEALGALMSERAGLGETGETYLVSLENNYLVTPSRFEGYELNRSYHSTAIDEALAGKSGFGEYTNYRRKASHRRVPVAA